MKRFLVFLTLLVSGYSFGQNLTFFFGGQISNFDSGKKEAGVSAAVVMNGKTVSSTTTGSNGKYILKAVIPGNSVYDVVFSKPGYVSKRVHFDFTSMDMSTAKDGLTYDPVGALDLEIFELKPNVDFSFLNSEPVASFKYNTSDMAVRNDAAMSQRVRQKIEELLKQASAGGESKKKYDETIKKADVLYSQAKYEEALPLYEQASGLIPTEIHPQNRIKEIDGILKAKEKDKLAQDQKDQAYKNLITAADNLRDQKKYTDAISKYQEAIKIKAETYPKDQVLALEKKISDEKLLLSADKNYQDAIKMGDEAFKVKNYPAAKISYEQALNIKKTEAYPSDQLKKIEDALKSEKDVQLKDQQYKNLITEGDNLLKTSKFLEAKLKYQDAKRIKPEETYPDEKIALIEQQLLKLSANSEKDKKINALFEEGQRSIDAKSYEIAKQKYQEILTLDPSKQLAQEKLKEIDRMLASEDKKKTEEEDFSKYVADGNRFYQSKNFSEAKLSYASALAIKEDRSIRLLYDKVVNELAAGQAQQLLSEKYNGLIQEADKLFDENKLDEARIKYKSASQIDETQLKPKERIAQIDKLMGAGKANDEKYLAEIKRGDQFMSEEKYLEAIKSYNSALIIKPYEDEPKKKASEAERLEKNKTTEVDSQFEKIISTAESKIVEKDYAKAEELLKRARSFRPNDKRAIALLAELENLRQIDKNFMQKMDLAQKMELDKNYSAALTAYTDANRLKPDEKVPSDKMIEMKKMLGEKSAQDQQLRIYEDYYSRGVSAMNFAKYDNALESFKMALKAKPDDKEAISKIEEINQILDDLKVKKLNAQALQIEFDGIISKADAAYRTKDFSAAITNYEKANQLIPNNKYVEKQILESERMLALVSSNEKDGQYNKLVNEADLLFEKGNWETSKLKYTEALKLLPTSAYPKGKIAEIDAFLNPKVVQNQDLQPLGEKFEGDASLALQKADLQRKNSHNTNIDEVQEKVINSNDSLSTNNLGNSQEIAANIYQVESAVILRQSEAAQDLVDKDQKLQVKIEEVNQTSTSLANYNTSKNYNISDKLDNVAVQQENFSSAQVDKLQAENQDLNKEVTKINFSESEKTQRLSNSLQVKSSLLNDELKKVETTNAEIIGFKKENQEQLNNTKIIVNAIDQVNGSLDYNQAQISQNGINQTILAQDLKTQSDSQIAGNNASKILETESKVIQAESFLQAAQGANSKKTDSEIYQLEDRILIGNELRDQNRVQGIDQLQRNQNQLDVLARQDSENNTIKQREVKQGLIRQETLSYNLNQQNQETISDNYVDLETVKGEVNEDQSYLSTKQDILTKKTTIAIDLVNDKVIENNSSTTAVQNLNQTSLNQTKTEIEFESSVNLKMAEDKVRDQKAEVERITTTQQNKSLKDAQVAKNNYNEVEVINDRNQLEGEKISEQNRFNQSNTLNAVNETTREVITSSSTTSAQQYENSKIMANEQAFQQDDQSRLADQNTLNSRNAKAKIDNVDVSLKQNPSKNSIGQEYPEGVTEESFSQNDDKGILKTIITRRVVVLNGHADVYLRTQTANNITYSKNGQAVTEYTWQRETQNGKLKRN